MGNWKTLPELKYTKNDEWLKIEGDTATMGITDYAQDQLNDIVYVEFPDAGANFKNGDSWGVVESVKAASDIYMPMGGTILEVNSELESDAEVINTDPYGKGWLIKFKIADMAETSDLLDAAAYSAYCDAR